MANIEKDKSNELSVDELVSKLKDNINSNEPPANAVKNDDGDIASMLKRFMPENEENEFELEDTLAADGDGEFEFDSDDLDGSEDGIEYESENSDFDVVDDAEELAEFDFAEEDAPEVISEPYRETDGTVKDAAHEDGEILSEPSDDEDDMSGADEDNLGNAQCAEAVPADAEESPFEGSSLLAGFASMLGGEDDTDDVPALPLDELPAIGTGTSLPDIDELPALDPEPHLSELDLFGSLEAQKDESDFAEAGDSEEFFDPNVGESLDEDDDMKIVGGGEIASPLYTFDVPELRLPEEEYFEDAGKNPLAFDADDDGPAVPDESAFAGVDDAKAIEAQMLVENKFAELSEDELNLMVGLGYENQIVDEDSKKKADEIAEKNSSEIVDPIDVDNSFAFDGMELSSSDQFRAIGNRYKQEHKQMKLRLIGTLILTLALLFFETITALSDAGGAVSFGGALNINRYPVVNIMISLQLLVLGCALSFHRLIVGLRDAVTFKPSPISVTSVVILCCIVYDLIMAFVAPATGLRTYNLTASVFLLGLVLNDYMNLSREIRAFNTISTRKPKLALTAAENRGEDAGRSFEARSVGFIEHYFRRTNVSSFSTRSLNLIILPFIGLAIILGIISYMTSHVAATAFNVAILTVVLGMPLSAMFITCYPIFAAVKELFSSDAAIIGDPSVEEYSQASSIVYQDKDVFPASATVMRGIKLYGDNVIYDVLGNLTKLYSAVGGPLKDIFEQTASEIPSADCAQLVSVEADGVEALIDGEMKILAGQRDFISRCGIPFDEDPDDARMISEGVSILYVVFDGALCAKLYVQYDIDHAFEEIINSLAMERIDTYITTADPCIDDALLSSRLRVSKFPAKIVKRGAEESFDGYVESADSGIVSRSSLGALARAVVLCSRIQRVRSTSRSVCTVSSIIAIMMLLFLAMFSATPNILSVYTVIYQLFWLIPMALFTRLNIK